MESIFDFLFGQYQEYSTLFIVLELIAVGFGVASVFFSRANNILVYPTGIVSTAIFVYLLAKWGLIGDLMVNAYYFIMSIYGWWVWTRKGVNTEVTPITQSNQKDFTFSSVLFLASTALVFIIYKGFDKLEVHENSWIPYVDIFTTAIFFVGMWLMARRKIEHWYFWIIGNIISIPLYFIKGFTFTSLQYFIFLGLAIWGIVEWRKLIDEQKEMTYA